MAVCYDADEAKAEQYAEDIRIKVSEAEFEVAGSITTSAGLTEIKKEDNFDDAFERMDKALYKAKSEGRNCVRTGK